MNIRRSILWLCAIVVVLLGMVVWFAKKPNEAKSNVASASASEPAMMRNQSQSLPPAHVNTATSPHGLNAPRQDKGDQIKKGLAALNDPPIDFYGKLEDQFGNPVANAQIKNDIRIYNGIQSTVEHLTTESDANGLFQINGKHGEALYVVPHKKGYALATTGTSFTYSYMNNDHFIPDPNNPTVIKMWKLQGAEPLVKINQHYKLPYTSAPICFDLIAGTIVPTGGDIKITVDRPPGVVSQQHPQNWSIHFEVVDGGFIMTDDKALRITYFAPESGYQSSDTFQNNNGPDMFDKSFFIKSRRGLVYSKLGLSFRINNESDGLMYITFGGVANTNSSGNWEGDPNTMASVQ